MKTPTIPTLLGPDGMTSLREYAGYHGGGSGFGGQLRSWNPPSESVDGVGTNSAPFWRMLLNSFVMAFSITLGKITVSMLSAFAIVWFRFPLRNLFFWMIFITLMLPVEVRIFPTVEVIANLQMLDSFVYALAALRISISRWQLDLSALLASLQEEDGAATNKKTLADYARALSGEDE